jgi:citrate lyase beta subunit
VPRSKPSRKQPALGARLIRANRSLAQAYPGDSLARQPVHTFIASGDAFTSQSVRLAGQQALDTLNTFAPTAQSLAQVVGLPASYPGLAETVRARIVEKLEREPIEDYRLDFEDGYGIRPDAEEDGHAASAASEVAIAMKAGTLPPFLGIRIKPLSNELAARSLRTLDIFVTTLVKAAGRLPANFAITATKVMTPAHVSTLVERCSALERKLRLPRQAIQLELMIETPQAILSPDGSVALPALIKAGAGRVRGAHFGVYDYTALCGITAAWQHPRHLACDVAREMMRVSLAQTGVMLSDGSSNLLPIPPHVHAAWKRHFDDVTHSLVNGFYQGWDLHPGHLPTRYAAVYAFYLAARPAATARLSNFFTKAAKAGAAFDDAATGQALVNFFARALSSGAITIAEAQDTGLTEAELRSGSFLKILAARRL